jgi:hypothetical protein
LFFGLEIIRLTSGGSDYELILTDICGAYHVACERALKTLTDPWDEVILLAFMLALIIAPQLISYVISGMFGCATAPLFVSQSTKIAIWSLVKFLVGLGAILASRPFAKLFVGSFNGNMGTYYYGLGEFVPGYAVTCSGFLVGAALAIAESASSVLRQRLFEERNRWLLRAAVKTQRWLKRNRSEEKPQPYVLEVHVYLPELNQDLHVQTRFRIR